VTSKRQWSNCVACRGQFECGSLTLTQKCGMCSEFGPDGDGVGADPEPKVLAANNMRIVQRGPWLGVEL
jgi:hypothetical protein